MFDETERLLVRRLTEDDAEALYAVLSDPEVMQYIEPPFSLEQTQAFIRNAGLCDPPLVYAVMWKQTGELIGHLIWHPWDETAMELGWILRRDLWGHGIAKELTASVLAQADQDVILECSPAQTATRHIAEAFGFHAVAINEERIIFIRKWLKHYNHQMETTMNNVIIRKELSGRVLDIGGGGEGVIGRVYGTQVTAIDISPEELAEAPEGFEKLVMDAGDMNFPDASFDHVTAFYSFLFIAKDQHAQVIAEIARVLRPGGELHIWDCEVASAYPEPFTVELDIDANGMPIHTTYGILEKDCVQTADRLIKACEAAGLRLCGTEQNGTQFCLRFRKGYEIRLAEEGDAAEIAELCTNELGYRTSREQVKEKLTALLKGGQERIIVAVADGRVVGFIHAAPYETLYFPPLKNLLGLAVAAAYRHRGIGSALLDAVEAWAKETGASGVRLNSGSTRLEAHQFYRKHGYGLEKQQLRLINFFENEGSPEK